MKALFLLASLGVLSSMLIMGIVSPAAAGSKTPSGMYVSVRDSMIGPDIFPTPIEGLRQLGVDAVELNLNHDFSVNALDKNEKVFLNTDDDVKAFRKHANALGIRICSILTACDFSDRDQETNSAWVARAIEIADLLGAPSMRIDSAMRKEKNLDFDTRVKLMVDGLSAALQKTPSSKVALGIENHGYQGNNLAFLLNVFQQVNAKRLGATIDTGNFYWRGYPLSEVYGILQILAPYAKHTHVKNIHYPEDKREIMREAGWEYGTYYCPLDEGDIDLAKLIVMLKKVGYQGDICIEDESIGKCKTPEERAHVVARDVAHIKKLLGAQ